MKASTDGNVNRDPVVRLSHGVGNLMVNANTLDDPSVRDAADVATAMGADLGQGLTAAEASRRLLENGPNTLRATAKVPAWHRALAQFRDPLVLLLLVAIAIALVAWWIEGRHGWPIDAVVIAIVVLLNAVLGLAQEAKADAAVAALAKMTEATAAVLRGVKPSPGPK